MNQFALKFAFWLVLGLLLVFIWSYFNTAGHAIREISYSDFLERVEQGLIRAVRIQGEIVTGDYGVAERLNTRFKVYIPRDADLIRLLREKHVSIKVEPLEKNSYIMQFLLSWGPVLLLIGLWIFFMRQMPSGGGKSLSKSRARLIRPNQVKVAFADIGGLQEIQEELQALVKFLRDPVKFLKLGGKIPRGVLIVGPPGTGKTLLAKAIAGEARVPFFHISGSEFVEIFIGVGAARVRNLFVTARKRAPCIIFIDEIDAVGRQRGLNLSDSDSVEREQTLNQLLVEMDGFTGNEGVIVMTATNRPDILDPALSRPGRFDLRITVSYPNTKEREEILRIHAKTLTTDAKVSLQQLAEATPGFSGADLSNVLNEAAILAARRDKQLVQISDIEDALEKVRRGRKEKLPVETNEDKWRVAIHETGHLSASFTFPCLGRIDSLSLYNLYAPEWFKSDDRSLPTIVTLEQAKGALVVLLAGRVAEEFFLGQPSNLCESDFAVATALAHEMIARWGMNKTTGLANDQLVRQRTSSNLGKGAIYIDTNETSRKEIMLLLEHAYTLAFDHIEKHASQIVDWAAKLFESETLRTTWLAKQRYSHEFKTDGSMRIIQAEAVTKTGKAEGEIVQFSSEQEQLHVFVDTDVTESLSDKTLKLLRKQKEVLEMQIAALGEFHAPPEMIVRLEDVRERITRMKGEGGNMANVQK